jgi:biopolymer transport protein ExbB/TolQ
MLQEIFDLFRARDPIPFIILAILSVGWIIVLERAILLQITYRVNFSKFNQTIRKMLAAGDLERARNYCKATAQVGLPLIAAKAIDAYQSDTFRVRMVVTEEILSFMPRIRRRISQLPGLATIAILLGALSAVHGVWQSFHTADIFELGIKSFAFTKGLSNALNPLALSLVATILLLLPYGLLEAIATRLEGEIEHSLAIILNILSPESETVMAQPSFVAAGSMDGGMGRMDSLPDIEPLGSESSAATGKGTYEDISADKSEPVPDEEEII